MHSIYFHVFTPILQQQYPIGIISTSFNSFPGKAGPVLFLNKQKV